MATGDCRMFLTGSVCSLCKLGPEIKGPQSMLSKPKALLPSNDQDGDAAAMKVQFCSSTRNIRLICNNKNENI
jgi:hypothetical protein